MGIEVLIVIAFIVMTGAAVLALPRGTLRSRILGASLVVVTAILSLGAWYSWAESNSIPWTLGYSTIAAISLTGAIRQFLSGGISEDNGPHPV